MIRKTEPAFYANIHMAGDIAEAKRICARFCMDGLCITVTEIEFVYTGGRENGFMVGLVNYPRFPGKPDEILNKAEALVMDLIVGLCQHTALIQTPEEAIWLSRHPRDLTSPDSTPPGEDETLPGDEDMGP